MKIETFTNNYHRKIIIRLINQFQNYTLIALKFQPNLTIILKTLLFESEITNNEVFNLYRLAHTIRTN